ncbi:protein apterous-like, partial [Diaphorina citri]|uniref:Protein apterous-like n=1 Tax=Diaphorina citri TaxID=121845 RepID=A0A1S3CWM3_DIACI
MLHSETMLKDRDDSSSPCPEEKSSCGGCGQPIIDRFYLLAVDRQWHLGCLQCAHCHVPLHSELSCFSRHGNIYCKQDFFSIAYCYYSFRKENAHNKLFTFDCPKMLHSGDLSSSMESLSYESGAGNSSPGSGVHSHQRTKRMRTSFKHHQLRTMKSYFNINQNPDAKDLKQLAQKTGLSKRVLQ